MAKAKKDSMFNIVEQSKYHITVEHIENIEDVDEEFINGSELEDLGFGIPYTYGSSKTTLVLKKKVISALQGLKAQITKSGKKSIKIDDSDLIDMFTSSSDFVSHYVDGLRRVGNRLSLTPKKADQTAPKKGDFSRLVTVCDKIMNKTANVGYGRRGVVITITYAYCDRPSLIGLFKKITTWKEVEKSGKEYGWGNESELKWMKVIWDNPTILETEEDKEADYD